MKVTLVSLILVSFFNLGIASADSEIDWDKTIKIGESKNYIIGGAVDFDKLVRYFESKGQNYVPKKNLFGKVNIAIGVTVNSKFKGCGCPKEFNEFFVFYEIDSNEDGKQQVVPDFLVSNHFLRQNSMTNKFGAESRLGEVGFINSEHPGFVVESNDGAVAVRARFKRRLNKLSLSDTIVDIGMHTLGGNSLMPGNEGSSLIPSFSRITGPATEHMSLLMFQPGVLELEIDSGSELGIHLKSLDFKTTAFVVRFMKDGLAWLP